VFAFLFRTAAFCVLAFVTSSGERFETILRTLSMSGGRSIRSLAETTILIRNARDLRARE
jgi:ABC-type nickel/cobalt efflux system permease component RcnA